MSDNRMKYTFDKNMMFPLAEVELEQGEKIYLQRGSMVYHTSGIKLSTKVNGRGKGLGKLMGAVGRSLTSNESFWITEAEATSGTGKLALAPNTPGEILPLELGEKQYHINDGCFLAMDGSANYKMESQSLGKAFFAGTGGLFIMTTTGDGVVLCNTFGSVKKLDLKDDEITIDNLHVVAWSTDLDYDIHLENGLFQSVGTGEGVVNTFSGTGTVYIQSLNLETFAGQLQNYIVTGSK